jgi:large subunit ribosomal protein L7Ae
MSSRRKKVTKGPVAKKTPVVAKDWKSQHAHLFKATPKDFRTGGDPLPAQRDLSRYVRWPKYIRLQRQRAILKKRLKVPPSINQFTRTLDKNQASTLFRLLSHYRPESGAEKKNRLLAKAEAEEKNAAVQQGKKPKTVKFGLNHVTDLVEQKKAKLVVIAHDVDPVELVVWLPALCRKMDVPYCIVKGKARLGQLVFKKTSAVLALTEVNKEDQAKLDQLVSSCKLMYNDDVAHLKKWGGGVMGTKANHARAKIERLSRE